MQQKRNKKWLVITLSCLLILIGISLVGAKHLYNYFSAKENDTLIEEYFKEPIEEINETVCTEEIVEEVKEEKVTESYISILEIPKINLKRGIYNKNSKLNNVDKNIYLLDESDMPDKDKGNFILAAHSGNSRVSFFNKLPNLDIGDYAYVYYKGGRFNYKLVNYYEVDKTGKAKISRNKEVNTMTLITCKHNSNKQLVYIFELDGSK